jgi:hypothetical protein
MYEATIPLTSGNYEFKVATDDWATVNLGAESADEADVELSVPKFLAQTNDNLKISIVDHGDYVFIWDATDLAETTITVFSAEFFGATPVYLRGGMNGWGTVDQLIYNGMGAYSVDITITAGDYEFKVASEDWAAFNFGALDADNAQVTLGEEKPLFTTNDNLKINIAADGTYSFTVNGPNGNAPTLIVDTQ